jgi:hypothetical protein
MINIGVYGVVDGLPRDRVENIGISLQQTITSCVHRALARDYQNSFWAQISNRVVFNRPHGLAPAWM